MENKIELAKFIHKFEVDLPYRKYMTEDYENEVTRQLAHDIACNSIDWVYFPKSESKKYLEISDKAYKETSDNYLCVDMAKIKNDNIDDKYADLILRSVSDAKLTEKYLELWEQVTKYFNKDKI